MSLAEPTREAKSPADVNVLNTAFSDLRDAAAKLVALPLDERIELTRRCLQTTSKVSRRWVDLACQAKQIPADSAARAEEITAGPVTLLRYLQLVAQTLEDVKQSGMPAIPGRPQLVNGQLQVPVFPTPILYDKLLFAPISLQTWLQPGVELTNMFGSNIRRLTTPGFDSPTVTVVLGAGNVSSIPATDALTKILQENQAVLLKMNPVNEYLGDIFTDALAPLVEAGFLKIVYGAGDVGAAALNHDDVDTVHITGSNVTHDRIVWGDNPSKQGEPALKKTITSELGNVSPWIIVPDRYTTSELRFQAENLAASIANNVSFNCIATKLIVTWSDWPQRNEFLNLLDRTLGTIPRRVPYYPGAVERFKQFAGRDPAGFETTGTLPWTLLRDVNRKEQPNLFEQESFVCVCAETGLEAESAEDFLDRAVEFANDEVWGTLACAMTVTSRFQKRHQATFERAVRDLRYGTVAVNQWPALSFAMMTPPWGGYPVNHLSEVTSGLGHVHNTFLLDRPQKTILTSATKMAPKPVWFSTHRRPESLAWKLCDVYADPRLGRLPSLFWDALMG